MAVRAWLALLAVPLLGCAGDEPEPPALDADRLLALTEQLTDLGPRLAGSEAEAAAVDAVEAMFLDAGAPEVSRHDFTWDAWRPGPTRVTGGGELIDGLALSPSPPTTDLELILADANEGAFTGAAALFSSDDGSRAGQYVSAALGGAGAMLRVTDDLDHDGSALVEVGHTLDGSTLPAIAFDSAAGARLRALVGQTVTLDIESETALDHTSQNVVARFPGADGGEAIYALAHYDSWHLSESAIDNALGVGMLVMFAEALQGASHDADIYLIATGAEEQGLQGAQAWVDDHEDDIAIRGELAITLDIPWSNEGWYLCGTTDDAWTALVMETADALELEPYDTEGPSPASDHVPFQSRGLDAAWCTRQPDRHYHTAADTLEWIDMAGAMDAWEVNRALLWDAAGVVEGAGE